MKILVFGRDDLSKLQDIANPYVWIGVCDSCNFLPKLMNDNCVAHVVLKFDDIEQPTDGMVMMSDEHAMAIALLLETHKHNFNTVVVSCEAGISRSSAIAAAMGLFFNGTRGEFVNTYSSPYIPNRHVFNKMIGAIRETFPWWRCCES